MSLSYFLCALLFLLYCAHVSAFFRLGCGASITVQRVDPIVSPGVLGTHVHMVTGGSKFNATTNSAELRTSQCTTCTVAEDHSAYWIPELYFLHANGSFEQIDDRGGGGLLIYYLQRANSVNDTTVYGIPQGLRMIAGTPTLRTFSNTVAQQAVTFSCVDYLTGHPESNAMPQWNCPQGLRAQVFFPSCWDGVNLDSADHKSHMAYPDGLNAGQCPPSHPKRLISLFYEKYYDTNRFAPLWLDDVGQPTRAQPFYWSTGDNTGFSFHGDFLDGWDTAVIAEAAANCNDDSGVIDKCKYFTILTGGQQSSCQPQYPTLSNEAVTGWLPGDLPGTAGHITVPAFDPCQPSPTAPWDGRGVGQMLNPRLCFSGGAPNTQPPTIGITSMQGCSSTSCIFLEAGGSTQLTTTVLGGSVTWQADGSYAVPGTYGTSLSNNPVVNVYDSSMQTLYQTMGYRNGLQYNFTLMSGQYQLRMGFIENYFTSAGQRVFSVLMNGKPVVSNLDIFAVTGAKNTAMNVSVPITVTSGSSGIAAANDYVVSLFFSASVNAPQVSFIAITPPAIDAALFGGAVQLQPNNPSGDSSSSNAGAIAGGVVGGLVGAALVVALVVFFLKRQKKNPANNNYMRDESRPSNSKPNSNTSVQAV